MLGTLNSFKYYEISSLSIEDKLQIKEYIDKEVSQQSLKSSR